MFTVTVDGSTKFNITIIINGVNYTYTDFGHLAAGMDANVQGTWTSSATLAATSVSATNDN
jgi:hypothetical protein